MNNHPKRNRTDRLHSKSGRTCCNRPPGDKEIPLADAGFDLVETAVLEVARYYWQTFALPQSQSWLFALQRAEQRFGGSHGGEAGLEILATVQAMRTSRSSCFLFNNPRCEGCAAMLTEHERQFMHVFRAMRDQRPGPARTHAMILCEGNDTDGFIERMSVLVRATYQSPAASRTRSFANHIH